MIDTLLSNLEHFDPERVAHVHGFDGPYGVVTLHRPTNVDQRAIAGVDDSKRLLPQQRERLATKIRARALAIALGAASVREIDRINIYQASRLAMQRALARLQLQPNHVLVDGRHIRTLPIPHTAVVHGDSRCFSIACASIIAKVTRDRVMAALARRHPGYLWEHNVGYTTRAHIQGLAALGITAHHRRSFWRVSQLTLFDLDLLPDEHQILDDYAPGESERTALEDLTIFQSASAEGSQPQLLA
jgi:ribonuclease HII